MRSIVIVCFFCIFITGCEFDEKESSSNSTEKSDSNNPNQKDKNVSFGQYGYFFEGTNENGNSCDTGVKDFETLDLMCVNIQDQKQNNHCAFYKRIDKFTKECEPAGHAFHDSMACEFSLYNKEVRMTYKTKAISQENIKFRQEYCVGRISRPRNISISTIGLEQFYLIDKIKGNIFMQFNPVNDSENTFFEIQLYKWNEYEKEQLLDIRQKYGLSSNEFGPLKDGSYKYSLTCHNAWACDVENF